VTLASKENESFLRTMRSRGVSGGDSTVALDRVYALLDEIDDLREGHVESERQLAAKCDQIGSLLEEVFRLKTKVQDLCAKLTAYTTPLT
jgi:hypothetical protein